MARFVNAAAMLSYQGGTWAPGYSASKGGVARAGEVTVPVDGGYLIA